VVWLISRTVPKLRNVASAVGRRDSPPDWAPERLIHRQTYIDLIRAYLSDYGSQRDLARALGLSEAYVSYLLEPLRLANDRTAAHWSVLLAAAGYEIAETFKYVKTPSQARAARISRLLTSDAERRDVLVEHIRLSRGHAGPAPFARPLQAVHAQAALRVIGEIHQAALYSPAGPETAASYARVWELARDLPTSIDPGRDPAEYAQTLMYLHDTAQALGRPDVALGFTRQALRALSVPGRQSREPHAVTRLRVNAFLAEAVTLNTLGLRRVALRSITHAETMPGFGEEPEVWLRSFLEQRLTAMSALPRVSRYDADSIAEQALSLVPGDRVLQAGVTRRHLDVYLTRQSARSGRKAGRLAEELRSAVSAGITMSPMRHAQILRTLARYHLRMSDRAATEHLIRDCLRVTTEANLVHQRAELVREFASVSRELA
jgi:hypothetical protein